MEKEKVDSLETLSRVIYEALGEASMCWSETPKGEFESLDANAIGGRVLMAVKEYTESLTTQLHKLKAFEPVVIAQEEWEKMSVEEQDKYSETPDAWAEWLRTRINISHTDGAYVKMVLAEYAQAKISKLQKENEKLKELLELEKKGTAEQRGMKEIYEKMWKDLWEGIAKRYKFENGGCDFFVPECNSTSATKCLCGKEKWQHTHTGGGPISCIIKVNDRVPKIDTSDETEEGAAI